ncbi:MAG: efflux RND transporter periplasmic adaptor subunit [Vulcanimicrobiaceae bacterium]
MSRNLKLLIAVVLLVALIGIAVLLGRGKHESTPVKTAVVALKPFVIKLPENGVVMHPRTETIPTLVGGNIDKILVRAGQPVQAGQLLATVYNPNTQFAAQSSQADYSSSEADVSTARVNEQNAKVQYEASVNTTKSQLDLAQKTYDEDVTLFKDNAIPHFQLDTDKAKLDQARVAYDQALAQLQLGAVSGYGQNSVQAAQAAAQKAGIVNAQNAEQVQFLSIVAPFDGVIQTIASNPNDALRDVQPGDLVTAGQSLFTIAEGSSYIVKAQVDEQDIINVRIGQRASVSGQDFGNHTISGSVQAIAPVATKSTDASSTAKQILTTIALDSTPEFLRDGMTADVDIFTTDIPHALVIPNDAISTKGGKSYVYVIAGGAAHKRQISIGKQSDTQTIVLSGLKPGDVVADDKTVVLTDGMAARPAPSASPSPTPSGT